MKNTGPIIRVSAWTRTQHWNNVGRARLCRRVQQAVGRRHADQQPRGSNSIVSFDRRFDGIISQLGRGRRGRRCCGRRCVRRKRRDSLWYFAVEAALHRDERSVPLPYRPRSSRRRRQTSQLFTLATGRRNDSSCSLVARSPTLSLYHTAHSLRHQPHIRRHFRLFETPSDRRLFRRLTSLRRHNKLHRRDRPEATRPSAVPIIPPEHSCDL